MGKKKTSPRLPSYRRHSSGRFAFVETGGKRHRLPGAYNSAKSKTAYYRLLTSIAQGAAPVLLQRQITVADLCSAYLAYALGYYVDPDGKPSKEYGHLQHAVRAIVATHGDTPVAEFGPIALKEVRQTMVDGTWAVAEYGEARPWARQHVNRQVNRCKRIFKWGAENELVPIGVIESLRTIQPLRKGKTVAAETPPVRPADPASVDALLPWLTPPVRAMVEIQRLTGMRSQSVCFMRPGDILRDGGDGGGGGGDGDCSNANSDVWLYVPGYLELAPQHKTAWRDKTLIVALGPRCQEILRPFLDRPDDKWLFSPQESEEWRREQQAKRAKNRKAARIAQPPKRRRSREIGDAYTASAYWRALNYAFKKAARAGIVIPSWHPHQLRHSMATLVKSRYGVEAARVYLGHDDANTTEIYAERDVSLARRIAAEIG